MSGGYYDYFYREIENKFGLSDIHYRNICSKYSKLARRRNALRDAQLSEMFYDFACLLHSLEWCDSGDTNEDDYQRDVQKFKERWLMRTDEDRRRDCREEIMSYAEELANSYFPKGCSK